MVTVKTAECSYKQRCYIQCLRNEMSWTLQRIADNQQVSVSTVWNICNGFATPRKKKGRPLKITTPLRRQLVATATLDTEHHRKPYNEIAEICGISAAENTLRRAFEREGYHRRIARKNVFLKIAHKERHLAFTEAHRHWTVDDW
jgi:hypothetical protein